MPIEDDDPLMRRPAWLEPDAAEELTESSVPDDSYFSSGSFSPVAVQLGDGAEGDEPEAEAPRRAPEIDDSPRVIAQLGEDPGVVSREDPDDA